MPNRSVIVTVVAIALAFGVMVSGCNRDNRTAMNTARSRRGGRAERGVRPAEVLAAQAYRPPQRTVYEPRMAVAPHAQFVGPVYSSPSPSPIPVYVPTATGAPVVYHAPELAMAQASLPPPGRAVSAPPPVRAPLPELEPMRYQRVPMNRTSTRPVAEVMVSTGTSNANRHEVQRALEPLARTYPAPAGSHGWVASPATAMRSAAFSY